MRKFTVLLLCLTAALAHAKVEDDKPLITPAIIFDRWLKAWSKNDESLSAGLQNKREMMLRMLDQYLTTEDGAEIMILMQEEPTTEFTDAITDLVRINSGILHEIDLNQFFMQLALHGDLVYQRGLSLGESGVTVRQMKEAFRNYLRSMKADFATTILKINLPDLRLSSRPSPEYWFIFQHMMTTIRQENIKNFRVVVTAPPDAWLYILETPELYEPIYNLEKQQVIELMDGSRLEMWQSCASLVEPSH